MSAIVVNWRADLTISQALALGLPLSTDPQIIEIIRDSVGEFSGLTEQYSDERQLVAGSDEFDLTSLPKGTLPNIDLTGLKVKFVKIQADPENSDSIDFIPGGGSSFDLFASGNNGKIALWPGDTYLSNRSANPRTVGIGDKLVPALSADLDAKYKIQLVAG